MMATDSSKQTQQLSYDSCCRLCLSDSSSGLHSVFGTSANSASVAKRIATTLGVKIDASDKATTSICTPCLQKIQNWHTYRKACIVNQTKLKNWMIISCTDVKVKEEPLDEQEESDIEIVESSEDSQLQFFPGHLRNVTHNQNYISQRQDEEDLPPALTPNHTDDDNSIDNNSMEANAPNLNKAEELNGPLDNRTCTVCLKKFHNSRNKQRHERNVHGVDGNSANTSQSTGNTDSIQETTNTPSKPNSSVSESSKIEFAAGLCLQSKSLSPPNKIPSDITLTRVEESYIYKCKVMISVFHSGLCCCHNLVYADHKRMITHLRSSSCWFPPFTCYNCLTTFSGRSSKMRHVALCGKLRMENLVRLSELRGRDDNKIRLYHNYKCTRCSSVFAFFEDYCDHIYYDHLENDTKNLCTICQTQFENFDLFKQHAFNECYLSHYCDICYLPFTTKEEFTGHCAEKHDNEPKYKFFEVVKEYKVLSNIEIANLLQTARNEASGKEPDDSVPLNDAPQKPEKSIVDKASSRDESHEELTHSPTPCISCENTYSSYHNMIRHLKTAHKFTLIMMQNPLVCPDCGITHGNLYQLVRHRKKFHPQDHSGPHTCLTCQASFKTSAELRKHIIFTHAPLLNNVATKVPGEEEEEEEEQVVDDEQNLPLKRKRSKSIGCCLKCEECDETFGRASELESHRNSHLNFKLYRDSKTTYRSSLSNDKADFTCEVCNTNFSSKLKLSQHAKVHEMNPDEMPQLDAEATTDVDDVKPLICKFCSAAFIKQRELYEHINSHHNSSTEIATYPRECIFCSKIISKPGAYGNHILMHKRLIADVDFVNNTPSTDEPAEEEKPSSKLDSNDDDSDYHTCKRCFKVFANRSTLRNHMKLHGITMKTPTRTSVKGVNKSTKLYWCNICHQGCQGETEFKRHKLEHLVESNDHHQLTMPNLMLETDLSVDNKLPSSIFSSLNKSTEVVFATTNHHKTGHYCKYCKISFSKAQILSEHMAAVHDEDLPPRKKLKKSGVQQQQQLYSCSICKKTFSTVGALQSHQGWHKRTKGGKYSSMYMIAAPIQPKPLSNKYFCIYCQIAFKDDTSLQLHTLEVHRNVNATIIQQQLVRCIVCNLNFVSAQDLDEHMMSHDGIEQLERKPAACGYCDKVFSRADTLAAHEKQYHGDQVKLREFKCHLCERVFDRNNSLAIHLKMHAKTAVPTQSQVKVYSCSICRIKFYLPKDLRNHIITTHPF